MVYTTAYLHNNVFAYVNQLMNAGLAENGTLRQIACQCIASDQRLYQDFCKGSCDEIELSTLQGRLNPNNTNDIAQLIDAQFNYYIPYVIINYARHINLQYQDRVAAEQDASQYVSVRDNVMRQLTAIQQNGNYGYQNQGYQQGYGYQQNQGYGYQQQPVFGGQRSGNYMDNFQSMNNQSINSPMMSNQRTSNPQQPQQNFSFKPKPVSEMNGVFRVDQLNEENETMEIGEIYGPNGNVQTNNSQVFTPSNQVVNNVNKSSGIKVNNGENTHNPFKQVNTPKVSEPVREETYISGREVDPDIINTVKWVNGVKPWLSFELEDEPNTNGTPPSKTKEEKWEKNLTRTFSIRRKHHPDIFPIDGSKVYFRGNIGYYKDESGQEHEVYYCSPKRRQWVTWDAYRTKCLVVYGDLGLPMQVFDFIDEEDRVELEDHIVPNSGEVPYVKGTINEGLPVTKQLDKDLAGSLDSLTLSKEEYEKQYKEAVENRTSLPDTALRVEGEFFMDRVENVTTDVLRYLREHGYRHNNLAVFPIIRAEELYAITGADMVPWNISKCRTLDDIKDKIKNQLIENNHIIYRWVSKRVDQQYAKILVALGITNITVDDVLNCHHEVLEKYVPASKVNEYKELVENMVANFVLKEEGLYNGMNNGDMDYNVLSFPSGGTGIFINKTLSDVALHDVPGKEWITLSEESNSVIHDAIKKAIFNKNRVTLLDEDDRDKVTIPSFSGNSATIYIFLSDGIVFEAFTMMEKTRLIVNLIRID